MVRDTALILDVAAGKKSELLELRRSFMSFARLNGWSVSVIHTDEKEAIAWQKLGLNKIYIGAEAEIDIDEFLEHTINNKHFRYIKNKALKESLSVEKWSAPLTNSQVNMLQEISDLWLKSGRREYCFIMGYFDTDYLKSTDAYVLTINSKPVAYVNMLPSYNKKLASIDHMRHGFNLPPVSMHFLLMNVIDDLAKQKKKLLNLGLVTLSKINLHTKNIQEQILSVIKKLGSRYYSFSGLEQFKGKFDPNWQPRYIMHQGSSANIINIINNLNIATAYKNKCSSKIPFILAIIAGVFYSSFPIAIFFNPDYAFTGFVSSLGQPDQPYDWLFNLLDILSGLLSSGILIYFAVKRASLNRHLRISLYFAIIGSLGAILAAIFSLPQNFNEQDINYHLVLNNSAILTHVFVSSLNSVGFFVAICLSLVFWYKKFGINYKAAIALIAICLATIGLVIGQIDPSTSGILQRLYIVSYAIWFVTFIEQLNAESS